MPALLGPQYTYDRFRYESVFGVLRWESPKRSNTVLSGPPLDFLVSSPPCQPDWGILASQLLFLNQELGGENPQLQQSGPEFVTCLCLLALRP